MPKPPLANSEPVAPVSRRTLLEASADARLIAGVGWGPADLRSEEAKAAGPEPARRLERPLAAFRIRRDAAQAYLDRAPPQHASNGDEDRYADKRASFAKTLPHNDVGEVAVEASRRSDPDDRRCPRLETSQR